MLNLLPRPVHALLDYAYTAKALAIPRVLDIENENAKLVFNLAAGGAFLSSIATRYEGGLMKTIPFNTHLKLDAGSALLILASPWLLGFAADKKARNAVIGLALLELLVFALSTPDPE